MSTSAESARSWVEEKKPSVEEIQSVIDKLVSRIENWHGDDEKIQGSIEAVDYLESQLMPQPLATDPSSDEAPTLDSSTLIPDAQPIELEQEVKQATFEALKAQLGKSLNTKP